MKKVLLHICCGVCAFACIKHLKEEGYCVEGFFYNPNIFPENEYSKRENAAKDVCDINSVKFNSGLYEPLKWDSICSAYANEPEGGMRCDLCYKIRLEESFRKTIELGCDLFTTTLSVSPHKKSKIINEIGSAIAASHFMPADFKKNDGFKKTMEFAKAHNVYRQNYCGCSYSLRQNLKGNKQK
ncbi:MAG: epoxyqueuosine reductase QueH [Candidatus Omnitrophica bacterium]|nr:epoxyqueuosine reductase QueH [Candidatus Omnitrophota bacterium]